MINEDAFNGCTALSSVSFALPNGVTSIRERAFANCTNLQSLSLPYSVGTSIYNYAFQNCTSLNVVRLPIIVIDRNYSTAFKNCPKAQFWFCGSEEISSRTWHYQVRKFGDGKFYTELRNINAAYAAVSPLPGSGTLVIPSTVGGRTLNGLGYDAFWKCTSMTGVTIPSTVTNIDSYAFGYCTALKTVTIPDAVGKLGARAFQTCTSLESVKIGANVPSLLGYVFYKCEKLTRVSVPDSVTTIANDAFADCSGLRCVDLPKQFVGKITKSSAAFSNCPSNLLVLYREKANGTTWYFSVSTNGKTIIENYDGVAISPKPSSGATLTIPQTLGGKKVTGIGASAFRNCGGIKQVNMSSGLEVIGAYAFDGCSYLSKVNFPDTLNTIGAYAFRGTALTDVTVPSGVTSIFDYAFANCSKLATAKLPPKLYQVNGTVFSGCPSTLKVTYPCYVTFNGDGSSGGPWIRAVQYGQSVGGLPTETTVSRTGYTLSGWYTAKNGGGTKIYSTTKVTDNVTYYAYWVAKQYTVTFNANGGTVSPASKKYSYNTALGTLPTPTYTGYTFNGWYTAKTGGTKIATTTKVTKDVTYYAQWTKNTGVTYTVTFNANGGSVSPTSKKVTANATIGDLPVPTRSGYTHDGWYTAASGGTKITTATKVTKNVTYYAHWTKSGGSGGGEAPAPAVDPDAGTVAVVAPEWRSVSAGEVLQITLRRTGGTKGRIAVKYKTQTSTGICGKDFDYVKDVLVWNDGQGGDKTVLVPTHYIAYTAYPIMLRLKLSTLTQGDYKGCVTPKLAESKVYFDMVDDWYPGVIVPVAPDPLSVKAGNKLRLTLSRWGGWDGRIAVKYKTQTSTGICGVDGSADFDYVKDVLVWENGELGDKTIEIPTYKKANRPYPLMLRVKLSPLATGANLGNLVPEFWATKIYVEITK